MREQANLTLPQAIARAWQAIAPAWPLENLIAVNPLQGLEHLPFEQALKQGAALFQQKNLPRALEKINMITIKWCQVFFDQGQATIALPFKQQGLYLAWRQLVPFDQALTRGLNTAQQEWLAHLPLTAEQALLAGLTRLAIPVAQTIPFFTVLLTSLPGWASYIKYRTEWAPNPSGANTATPADYLALRVILACMLWPAVTDFLASPTPPDPCASLQMAKIKQAEQACQASVLNDLLQQGITQNLSKEKPAAAQLVFCIDVRSEPFRRALEAQGDYQTFGAAGFFGLPIKIANLVTDQAYVSCPVIVPAQYAVTELPQGPNSNQRKLSRGKQGIKLLKQLYQTLKYNFTTPFVLVEGLGPWSGWVMAMRTLVPRAWVNWQQRLEQALGFAQPVSPALAGNQGVEGMPLEQQCAYAYQLLYAIGLTANFARLVVFCGHGSTSQNNAYSSALDCGACGGHSGEGNARIIAAILNQQGVRDYLAKRGIVIPGETQFIAGLHNTTTDAVTLYPPNQVDTLLPELNSLKHALALAQQVNAAQRYQKLTLSPQVQRREPTTGSGHYLQHLAQRAADWAQTRPEWGLAGNAVFIIGPRSLTARMDLAGRAFLHSYDWAQDATGSALTTILTGPLVVAQWINSQYLFSMLDNVAYGSGNKATHNITGKIGIMQGNASDLMSGLPWQSLYYSDDMPYHQPVRLMAIIYAPPALVAEILVSQPLLKQLVSNGWINLTCIEPTLAQAYSLQRDMTWQQIERF